MKVFYPLNEQLLIGSSFGSPRALVGKKKESGSTRWPLESRSGSDTWFKDRWRLCKKRKRKTPTESEDSHEKWDKEAGEKGNSCCLFFFAHAVRARGSDGHKNVLSLIGYSHMLENR